MLSSCSTTKRLADGQTLYTGVKKMEIAAADGSKVPDGAKSAVKEPLSVKPNNPLFSPYVRSPLPIGLWAYNSFYTDRKTGFKAWLYRSFAKQPVLIETDVQPDLRVRMVEDILDNLGYFGSEAAYEILPKKNPKKAKMSYRVSVADPWYFETVRFPAVTGGATREIAAMKAASNLKKGQQYNVDTLTRERVRITNNLRNKSYYYFRPQYLEYQADTTRADHGVDLRMNLAPGVPEAAMQPYNIGDVKLLLFSAAGNAEADSVDVGGMKVWYQKPLKLRPKVLAKALRPLQTGQPASLPVINRTLNNMTRLGVFRYVNLEVTPLDSLRPGDPLDMTLSAAMDTPMEAEFELDLAYESSSFIGPSAIFGVKHKNIFRGGEVLALKLNGSYAWQTGNTSSSANSTAVNSYEIGLTASLTFPRMIVPGFVERKMKYGGRTSYQLGVDLMNRPKFFKMLTFNFSNVYDFRTSRTVTHSLTPFKMVFNNLLSTTADFDQTMAENPAIALSFQNQFIPSGSYTYTYDKKLGKEGRDRFVWQATLMTAGNVWAGIYRAFGVEWGDMKILGQPFSEFLKGTTTLTYYKQVGKSNTWATRFYAGAGYAYGNSTVMPYTEQFYIGGANSIRAYTIRSIGPGGYVPDVTDQYGYFDQTGDFKLELNTEFRFNIFGGLNGAVFFDAGNIWLLENDPDRPKGQLGSGGFFGQVATGTGAGIRYDLTFLVVRLDLGIGIHLPYDTGRSGYYNIPRFKDGLGLHLAIGYPF